jgi:molecular chaperone Hsp33
LLTLRIDSEGPIRQIIVTSGSHGNVKGYVANPFADLPLKDNGQPDVGGLIGKGVLRVIKDMGFENSEPYVGLSNLQTSEIAEDLAYYYYTSEQIPTVIALGVSLNNDLSIKKAGGFMIQLMPNAEDGFIDKLEEKLKAIRPVTELLEGGMSPERIAELLYEDMESEDNSSLIEEYEILEKKEVNYLCDCNKDKFLKGLITLGKKEINSILEKDGEVEVECHFCRTKYSFTDDDFKKIF